MPRSNRTASPATRRSALTSSIPMTWVSTQSRRSSSSRSSTRGTLATLGRRHHGGVRSVSPAPAVEDAVTALDLVTLGIAVSGLVIAVVGLTWQVLQHRLTGSVVRAELLVGAFSRSAVVAGPPKSSGRHLQSCREQGFTDAVAVVRGRNIGRTAVDITHWDVGATDGFSFSLPGYERNPTLPYRLEPGSAVDFYCPLPELMMVLDVKTEIGRTDRRLRAVLSLGTGKPVRSDWESFL